MKTKVETRGRPKLAAKDRRKNFICRIKPTTRDYLDELGEIHEAHFGTYPSDGVLIDLLVENARKRAVIK